MRKEDHHLTLVIDHIYQDPFVKEEIFSIMEMLQMLSQFQVF